MKTFKNNLKNLNRAKEIILILAKFGLAGIFESSKLKKYLDIGMGILEKGLTDDKLNRLTIPQRARMALEKLGPTFIKFGQIISTRPDLVPEEYIIEFSKLQDDVPPFPSSEVVLLIEKELGKKPDELYKEFDMKPFAAASLSQVHRGVLKNGKTVAIKIQRPNIRDLISMDITILSELAKFVEARIENGNIYKPAEIIGEFSRTIKNELDFMNEARNIDRFMGNFSKDTSVRFPFVYWELTTSKIITMEYIGGMKLASVMGSKADDHDRKIVAERYTSAILKMIYEDGFFHADPHPGNVNILMGNIIAFLDLGMVGKLDEKDRENIADLLISIINTDADKIIDTFEAMGIITAETDIKALTRDLKDFVDRYYGLPLKDMRIGEILEHIFLITKGHQISFPSELALLAKAMITSEGVVRSLDPNFNMVEHSKPFVEKLLVEKYAPEKIFKKLNRSFVEVTELLQAMPDELMWLLRSLRKGELNVGIKLKYMEKILMEMDRASNRLSFSLIIASIIVGSSLITTLNRGPFIFGYPIVGILGFFIAGILGLGLVVDIIWRGKLK